ncbi:MAG: phytoene/squalene synthase family protein [Terracidiphilus sp.]
MTFDPQLDAAYAVCRAIARREAKNFYYAFLALPEPRRNAICAIYAFMRQADDLADDDSLPREERRRRLQEWQANWRAVCHGPASPHSSASDPVFIAASDTVQRFAIPLNLLDELIAGVTMDLERAANDCHPERSVAESKNLLFAPATYATFADLYRYCYLVASVVGLVSIRIFGYSDPRAEKLAEETGIAFQLTNILRDVTEDAARNRVYLPLEDLAVHNVSLDSLLHRAPGAPPTANERALLEAIAFRAEIYYQSAEELLPHIDPESRPALWVLVSIYHGLLKRIEKADYDVFSRRASLLIPQKLAILVVGLARMAWARLVA